MTPADMPADMPRAVVAVLMGAAHSSARAVGARWQ